ncbi:GNAT family N-acetyltransferase [Tateyamaria sp.]|uniref:GNAT family N-acetyltransferase n=1 Tax=Tateyamaria sp. TaxID=1929288 RepID=UPI003B20D5B4
MSYHLDTPVLTTDRLILRAPQAKDADAFISFYATERAQFTGGPMTERQAWNFFGTEIGHWMMHGFGMFAVTEKGDDTAIGIVGHWYPRTWPEKEVGWVLFDAEHEGKGIALEAARACINHAWTMLKWETIVSYIATGNTSSIALAERLGATLDPMAAQPKPDSPCLVYRHKKGMA